MKTLSLVLSLAAVCLAQTGLVVQGELKGAAMFTAHRYAVELHDPINHRMLDRAYVAGDGSFDFKGVEPGWYEVRVLDEFGALVATHDADLRPGVVAAPLSIRLDKRPAERPAGTSVSVAQLRHTPPRKARSLFRNAQKYSERGQGERAIGDLEKAVALDPQFAEAYTNLGVQYLKRSQPAKAEAALSRAAELDGASSLIQSNLAFVKLQMGRLTEAEVAARRALSLEPASSRANLVMGYVLARKPRDRDEAIRRLEAGAREFPSANLLLDSLRRSRSAGLRREQAVGR